MTENRKNMKIKILKNGPYLVSGNIPLSEKIIVTEGFRNKYRPGREFPAQTEYALCRCGHSGGHPFCDGTHEKIAFDGTETASRSDYAERAKVQTGPDLTLLDDSRCAFARFCHRRQGSAWDLTDRSDDPDLRREAIAAAVDCPAGRLVALDRDGTPIEQDFMPAVEILQDPEEDVSGPLYVKGNIPLESADGTVYETRNRMTLCRCGESCHKPFCDAAHVATEFRDRFFPG